MPFEGRRSVALGVVMAALFALTAMRLAPLAAPASSITEAAQGSGRFFDDVAPTYDLLNRFISLGLDMSWRRAAANAAGSGMTVLDVATGTGDLAAMLVAGSAFAQVTAIDPSTEMLARMRTKRSVSTVRIVLGTAEELPFDDGTFDAVTVAFGVRNFANRGKGLAEMARVLRPNGRLVILEASEPDESGVMPALARMFIRRVVPIIATLLSGSPDAYRYLRDSMGPFPKPQIFQRMLHDVGLAVESHERLWPFGTGPDMYVGVKRPSVPPREGLIPDSL
jgi:demethylmenaquinone methyltransferase / 2-methoxy-6-polyprenyl-1,4-benzoquinol methylase